MQGFNVRIAAFGERRRSARWVVSCVNKEGVPVADIKTSTQNCLKTDGSVGAALVDYETGLCLAMAGNPGFDLELAAAGNAEVVRAKTKIRDKLGIKDRIEDILLTLEDHYHLIRMVGSNMFFYVVLQRNRANLAMARRDLSAIEKDLQVDRR
jgi:predicted regulator of Ras-like GTPase activity (Roadblock/LC7/MglB family)